MIRLEIEFDKDKIKRENLYDYSKMVETIDSVFGVYQLPRKTDDTEMLVYTDNKKNTDLGAFFVCIFQLEKQQWFMDNLIKWVYYHNDEKIDLMEKNRAKKKVAV